MLWLCWLISQYYTDPDSSVGGCLWYFFELSEEELAFYNRLNPSRVLSEGGLTRFDLCVAGADRRHVSVLVLTSFYLEYVVYCVLRDVDDLYSARRRVALQQSVEGGIWAMTVACCRACEVDP